MKYTLIIGLLAGALFSCSTETAETSSDNVQQSQETTEMSLDEMRSQVDGNHFTSLEVEGMSCVKGCGTTIKTELYKTGAVADCEFDFEDGREVNVATVTFDESKISEEELIEVINGIDDGRFHAENVEISDESEE